MGAALFFLLLWTFYHQNDFRTEESLESKFFSPILNHIVHAPTLKNTYDDTAAVEIFPDSDKQLLNKEYLEGCVPVPEDTLEELKKKHGDYVNFLKSKQNKVDAFALINKGTNEWKQYKGKSGVIYIGGGKYSWLSYLSIVQLRRTGSSVPVELFIPSYEEYEDDFCNNVLPKYNAKCVLFNNPAFEGLKIGGYQYKMLALMLASFENTLYLDSDMFPLINIDYLFESDLYKKNGLLLWPDAWARTTNPKYYQIAGINVVEKKIKYSDVEKAAIKKKKPVKSLDEGNFSNSNFHDFQNTITDPTIEAGVILVNKSTHVRTLQLALYYNVLGPDFYYPLLTQGSAGEGDKETFNAAAFALGEKYHVCSKSFSWLGYHNAETGEFSAKGLGIHDPVQTVSDPTKDKFSFVHCSYPKYYPNYMVSEVRYGNGNDIRLYESLYETVGYDVDLRFADIFTERFCENYSSENHNDEVATSFLSYIQSQKDGLPDACEKVFIPHLEWLRNTTQFPETNNQFNVAS